MLDANQQKTIAENLQRVRHRIEQAAQAAGRTADEVELVAVTKYVDISTTAALLDAGCDQLGESRPQQLWQKADDPSLRTVHWHLIGHLQRNKVQRTLPLVELIHSVDSPRLLKSINDATAAIKRKVRVLLEVNTSGEQAKHGLRPQELQALLPSLPNYPNLKVCGLMTMAAHEGGPAVAARNFASLRELRDLVQTECPADTILSELSMGMSQDFEQGIREGATLVRIGSLLFEGIR